MPKEDFIARLVMDEVGIAKSNYEDKVSQHDDFEEMLDIYDNVKKRDKYEWMSDISIPEYMAQHNTELAIDVSTFFQTREYTEVYLEDKSEEAVKQAGIAKEVLNRTLNQRHLNHYPKYVRARSINYMNGSVYARLWWEQELKTGVIGQEARLEEVADENGDLQPHIVLDDILGDIPILDRFNYDIIDPRNIFYDDSYTYSLQDKKFVTIRYERSMEELENDKEEFGYFDLDKIGKPPPETKTSKEAYNKDADRTKSDRTPGQDYDIYERHSKYWAVVEEWDESEPVRISIGIDDQGKALKKAELIEVIIAIVDDGGKQTLIRFDLQPYMDSEGKRYRPVIRGLNNIHPSRDGGTSDGNYVTELQLAMNDSINLANDRVKMATLPVLIARRNAAEDNDTLYLQPDHVIEVDEPKDDIKEFKIESDVGSAIQQMAIFRDAMQTYQGIYPTTQGQEPADASTTATAIAESSQRTNARTNYRSMTFEHTFLTEFYWMILQMTWQFATKQTGLKLMGDEESLELFNPAGEYFYKPITQGIETEYSKQSKIQTLVQLVGYLSNIPNPKTFMLLNFLTSDILELMGKETAQYAEFLLDENAPQEGGSGQQELPALQSSNQAGLPVGEAEQMIRSIQ